MASPTPRSGARVVHSTQATESSTIATMTRVNPAADCAAAVAPLVFGIWITTAGGAASTGRSCSSGGIRTVLLQYGHFISPSFCAGGVSDAPQEGQVKTRAVVTQGLL